MMVNVKCPKCGSNLIEYFETTGWNGTQNEEHSTICTACGAEITVHLKEVAMQVDTYLKQKL